MAELLVVKEGESRKFGAYGSITDTEHYEMLTEILEGKYPNLSNLKFKDYDNQNDSNGFVAYAFSYGNDTVCAFRGSEGNKVGDDGFLSTVYGKTDVDWMDNYYTGFKNTSVQFKAIEDFMIENMVKGGQTYVTGHSKGGADAIYAAAVFDGVKGFAFDGTGIGQCLTSEQRKRLENNDEFTNCVDQYDPVGALLFHSEKRIYSLHKTCYKLDINGDFVYDENGEKIEVSYAGALDFGGHYVQAIEFDENGNVILGERSEKSITIESVTQATWTLNELGGQPLGILIDVIKIIKADVEIVTTALSDIKSDISKAYTTNIEEAQNEIEKVISDGIQEINQRLSTIGNDFDAISKEINAGIQSIKNKIDQIVSDMKLELSTAIDQIASGFSEIGDGLNLFEKIENIKDRIDNGDSILESAIGEDIAQLNKLISGVGDIKEGIDEIITDSIKGTTQLLGTLASETGKTLWNIKDEMGDLVVEGAQIVFQIEDIISGVVLSITSNIEDFAESIGMTITENFMNNAEKWATLVKELIETDIEAKKVRFNKFVDAAKWLNENFNPLQGLYDAFINATKLAIPRIDPLALDLDGDGVETVGLSAGVYFDLDNNGRAERTGWVSNDDGILVYDKNGDHIINDGTELFGDRTLLSNGNYAANGFQALAEYDENKDGKIDANDSIFKKLRVWKDSTLDGFSESGELHTLDSLKIQTINLGFTNTGNTLNNGKTEVRKGSFVKDGGTSSSITELLFQRNTTDTISTNYDIEIENVITLPELAGNGNMASLREKMAEDSILREMVSSFVVELDGNKRRSMFKNIIYKWVGCETIDPGSRGGNIDARNLVTLEKYFGNNYVGANGANPNALAVPVLENTFKDLSNWMYGYMVSQTILKDIIKSITIIGGLDTVIEKINAAIDTDKNVGLGILGDFIIALDALKIKDSVNFNQFRQYYVAKGEDYGWAIDSIGKNIIQGTTSNDILTGTSNDDAIYGGTNDDNLTGNDGNDLLCGGEGIDTVNGGDGADTIYGGKGNDTYVFNLGDGQDIIQDFDWIAGNIDVITFGKGILAENVFVERKGDNIELSIKGTEDKIIIANYFSDYYGNKGYYIVEKIKFADGTEWGIADIKSAATIIRGTEGNDTISGGKANDKLYGGNGNDTYIFGKGYGQDIIDNTGSSNTDLNVVLLKDIKSNEVEFETTVKDLSIKVKGTNDKITISGYFNGGEYSLEELRFEDGITLSDKEIISNYSEEGSYSLTNSLNILKQTYCATSTDLAINSTQKSTSLSSNEDINLFVNKN